MALFTCPECNKSISDKAKMCPNCGFPVNRIGLLNRMSEKSSKLVNAVVKPFDNPNVTVNIDDVLQYTSTMSEHFSPGRRINGIGTTVGGHVLLPGYSDIGFIKKYFSILWIPIIPLGTYLVQDWDGFSGKFIGKIDPKNAARFVNRNRQNTTLGLGALGTLALVVTLMFIVSFLISFIR